ncbi:hypothetical protein Cgig2_011801 [Carnegiea gigantea]|uniref:Uncharacterized protein n=1 Tax=Carnegiea gigantea TaxID=171969 RepID=A0A9Q1GPK2_9CARY|nr:hypothetical protein Cgig2_011801 [Carnegiea gigantea]
MSNHFPILLKCNPNVDGQNRCNKHFKFENMWFTNPSCSDVFASAWTLTALPDAVHNLILWLENCLEILDTFGHVGSEIRKLEAQLKQNHDATSRRHILEQLRDWRKTKEILWWHRARLNYVVTPRSVPFENYKVSDLIDHASGCWGESWIKNIFLPCDARLLADNLIWHYHSRGSFTIRSSYHMLVDDALDSSSNHHPKTGICGGLSKVATFLPKSRFFIGGLALTLCLQPITSQQGSLASLCPTAYATMPRTQYLRPCSNAPSLFMSGKKVI